MVVDRKGIGLHGFPNTLLVPQLQNLSYFFSRHNNRNYSHAALAQLMMQK